MSMSDKPLLTGARRSVSPESAAAGDAPRVGVPSPERRAVAHHAKPTIEEMTRKLRQCGWTPRRTTIWQSPSGAMFYGPYQAWRRMREAEWQKANPQRPGPLEKALGQEASEPALALATDTEPSPKGCIEQVKE